MIKNNKQKQGLEAFLALCTKISSARELALLFDVIFTAEEKCNLGTRFLIISELLKGEYTQREMAKMLNVSIAKITRGSNALKQLSKALQDKLTQTLSAD